MRSECGTALRLIGRGEQARGRHRRRIVPAIGSASTALPVPS
jgi:hypothetical protein